MFGSFCLGSMQGLTVLKARDTYDTEIATITDKIENHDSEVTNLDTIFQKADDEHKVAIGALEEAKSALARIGDEKKEIQQRYDDGVKERTELQVRECSQWPYFILMVKI